MKVKSHTRKVGSKTVKVKGHNRKGRGRKKNYSEHKPQITGKKFRKRVRHLKRRMKRAKFKD